MAGRTPLRHRAAPRLARRNRATAHKDTGHSPAGHATAESEESLPRTTSQRSKAMASTAAPVEPELLRTLPSDAARQIQWRFADRYDLHMLVQSTRSVARGPVARLVASGGRHSHEWTPAKD